MYGDIDVTELMVKASVQRDWCRGCFESFDFRGITEGTGLDSGEKNLTLDTDDSVEDSFEGGSCRVCRSSLRDKHMHY
jgi:hypothetical protein